METTNKQDYDILMNLENSLSPMDFCNQFKIVFKHYHDMLDCVYDDESSTWRISDNYFTSTFMKYLNRYMTKNKFCICSIEIYSTAEFDLIRMYLKPNF